MTKIINMTPHSITVANKVFEPSGETIRLQYETETIGNINGIDLEVNTLTGHNLPNIEPGIVLIVSAMVLNEFPERIDLIAPNTNKAIRNDQGHIISVPNFITKTERIFI